MINTGKLAGRTVFVTGASRGIGKAIAMKAAQDGANIVIAAKTATAHPKLPGTVFTAAEEIEKAGGKCLPCIVDVRDESQVRSAISEAVKKFGGIDILVNNASAISLTPTDQTDMKRYDLMHQINTRGTFLTKLHGLTVFITGASRGIGKAIALKVAQDGANIVIAAKTAEPHPKLDGTIFTAAAEIEAAGGKCLPCIVDVRNEEQVKAAVQKAVDTFGGIDILINNASAISLTDTEETAMKKFDLMHSVNVRGTFLVTKECLPYLKQSKHGHVLMLSPPLNMSAHWFRPFVAYTMSKYGMSMCVLGMHEEFKEYGIGVNALWPRTVIHTAASDMLSGKEAAKYARKPEIMADAAYIVLLQDPKKCTGNFFIDQELLMQYGVRDFDQYACDVSNKDELQIDVFVDADENPTMIISKL